MRLSLFPSNGKRQKTARLGAGAAQEAAGAAGPSRGCMYAYLGTVGFELRKIRLSPFSPSPFSPRESRDWSPALTRNDLPITEESGFVSDIRPDAQGTHSDVVHRVPFA